MSTSRKAMDWLICFPIANLILGCLLFKKLKKFNQFKKLLISSNMSYPRKNLIYLKQVCTFESNQTKFENPKSLLPLKRFIVCFLTTLNPRKPKVRYKRISRILLILTFTTTNLLHVYYVIIACYETLGGIKILL